MINFINENLNIMLIIGLSLIFISIVYNNIKAKFNRKQLVEILKWIHALCNERMIDLIIFPKSDDANHEFKNLMNRILVQLNELNSLLNKDYKKIDIEKADLSQLVEMVSDYNITVVKTIVKLIDGKLILYSEIAAIASMYRLYLNMQNVIIVK